MNDASWYQVLGVSGTAKTAEIRKAYLAKVREFPPETHAEAFEAIRQAYEVLSHPDKRKQYDANLQGMDSEDVLIETIRRLIDGGQWKKIITVSKDVPEPHRSVLRSMSYLHQGKWEQHVKARDKALKAFAAHDEESLVGFLGQCQELYTHLDGRAEEARLLYDRYRESPTLWKKLWQDYAHILTHLDRRGTELVPMMDSILPKETDLFDLDQGTLLLEWYAYVSENSSLASHLKRYRNLTVHYWRGAGASTLDEFKETVDDLINGMIAEQAVVPARALAELVTLIDRKDTQARHRLFELGEVMMAQSEVDRMIGDQRLYPMVGMQATAWLIDKMGWTSEESSLFQDLEPRTPDEREWYAGGIARLKKSYPASYRMFQEAWQERMAAMTQGMNREQRRRLMR